PTMEASSSIKPIDGGERDQAHPETPAHSFRPTRPDPRVRPRARQVPGFATRDPPTTNRIGSWHDFPSIGFPGGAPAHSGYRIIKSSRCSDTIRSHPDHPFGSTTSLGCGI